MLLTLLMIVVDQCVVPFKTSTHTHILIAFRTVHTNFSVLSLQLYYIFGIRTHNTSFSFIGVSVWECFPFRRERCLPGLYQHGMKLGHLL